MYSPHPILIPSNGSQNTVIVVVTEVIDQRDSKNVNRRYLTRQLESNRNAQEQAIIVISESQTMTIGGDSRVEGIFPTATGVSGAESTGSVQQFGTYDPSAPAAFVADNAQQLLPEGIAAPSWSNAQFSQDPAEITLENPSQGVFVSFSNEKN